MICTPIGNACAKVGWCLLKSLIISNWHKLNAVPKVTEPSRNGTVFPEPVLNAKGAGPRLGVKTTQPNAHTEHLKGANRLMQPNRGCWAILVR